MSPLTPSAAWLQLVTPTRVLPSRPGWMYEPKLNGCRVLLRKDGPMVHLLFSALSQPRFAR